MAEMLSELRGRQERVYELPESERSGATAKINEERNEALEALTAEELAKARLALMVEEYRLYVDSGAGLTDIVEPEDIQWMEEIRTDAGDVAFYLRRRVAEVAGDDSSGQLLTDEQIDVVLAELEDNGGLPLMREQFATMFREFERELLEPVQSNT